MTATIVATKNFKLSMTISGAGWFKLSKGIYPPFYDFLFFLFSRSPMLCLLHLRSILQSITSYSHDVQNGNQISSFVQVFPQDFRPFPPFPSPSLPPPRTDIISPKHLTKLLGGSCPPQNVCGFRTFHQGSQRTCFQSLPAIVRLPSCTLQLELVTKGQISSSRSGSRICR